MPSRNETDDAAMNRNALIVCTLLDALAGKHAIKLVGHYSEQSYVDSEIGPLKIKWWTRMSLRRIAAVTFPDGSTIDYEETETVPDPWVPPKDEFRHWWALMGSDHAKSEQELADESFALITASRAADKQGNPEEAKRLRRDWVRLFVRPELYYPFSYLTDEQQDQMENILRQQSK